MSIKGGKVEGEGVGKNLLCKNSQSKIYEKHSGRSLLLRRRVEPLKKFIEYLFPKKFTLFIAVSHTRDTDHGVGSNYIPTDYNFSM